MFEGQSFINDKINEIPSNKGYKQLIELDNTIKDKMLDCSKFDDLSIKLIKGTIEKVITYEFNIILDQEHPTIVYNV